MPENVTYVGDPVMSNIKITRELAENVVKHLAVFLDHNLCECEGRHVCGRDEVESDMKALRCVLDAEIIESQTPAATVLSVIQRKTGQFAFHVHDYEALHPGTKLYLESPEPVTL
jgi:hypothetical protein